MLGPESLALVTLDSGDSRQVKSVRVKDLLPIVQLSEWSRELHQVEMFSSQQSECPSVQLSVRRQQIGSFQCSTSELAINPGTQAPIVLWIYHPAESLITSF